jgi:hypothetical protein
VVLSFPWRRPGLKRGVGQVSFVGWKSVSQPVSKAKSCALPHSHLHTMKAHTPRTRQHNYTNILKKKNNYTNMTISLNSAASKRSPGRNHQSSASTLQERSLGYQKSPPVHTSGEWMRASTALEPGAPTYILVVVLVYPHPATNILYAT